MTEKNQRKAKQFIKTEKGKQKEYIRKENALLSKPREVKRISDILMLELKVIS